MEIADKEVSMTIKECLRALESRHIGNRVRAIEALNKIADEKAKEILLSLAGNEGEKPYIRYYAKKSLESSAAKRQFSVVSNQYNLTDPSPKKKVKVFSKLLMTGAFFALAILTFLYIDYGDISEVSGSLSNRNNLDSIYTSDTLSLNDSTPNPYKLFELAESKYNVDAEVIEFLWFQESSMGRNLGEYRILDVYKIKKDDSEETKKWKKKERAAFLQICKKNGLDCKKQSGGKHGEMGPFQFMPSTWLVYGQDGSGDGLSNPWDMEDAAHTAAYYLKHYGYKKGDFTRIKKAIAFYNQSPAYFNSLERNAPFFGLNIKVSYLSK